MAEKFTFTMTGRRESEDAQLKELAANLKQQHGLLARIPQSLHDLCASRLRDQAKALHFSSNKPMLECLARAREMHPHLLYFCVAQIADAKPDVVVTEGE